MKLRLIVATLAAAAFAPLPAAQASNVVYHTVCHVVVDTTRINMHCHD